MYSKIDSNHWVPTNLLSRIHAILATENWSLSDPDPKLIITDPYPDPQHWIRVIKKCVRSIKLKLTICVSIQNNLMTRYLRYLNVNFLRLGVPNGSSTAEPPSPIGGYQQVVASGHAGGGITHPVVRQMLPPPPPLSSSVMGSTGSGVEPLNRILNALSNRGLLTQQNGKFYYVGGEKMATATTTTSSSAALDSPMMMMRTDDATSQSSLGRINSCFGFQKCKFFFVLP